MFEVSFLSEGFGFLVSLFSMKCEQLPTLTTNFEFQVRQEISPVVLTVISCLVPILQHAEVTVLSYSLLFITSSDVQLLIVVRFIRDSTSHL